MPERDKLPVDSSREAGAGLRRFRLPKLFAESDAAVYSDAAVPLEADPDNSSPVSPVTDNAGSGEDTVAAYPDAASGAVNNSVDEPPAALDTMSETAPAAAPIAMGAGVNGDEASAAVQVSSGAPVNGKAGSATARGGAVTHGNAVTMQELQQLREDMEDMGRVLHELNDRGSAQDKVFNVLHKELQDYKNDFIYERLKPMVRPLLFLFDSLEQFDAELAQYVLGETQPGGEDRATAEDRLTAEDQPDVLAETVRHNVSFFRDQLVEALRICEVTPMEKLEGHFDARLHKAIDTVQVAPEQDNVVQRVVRSGWYLNGHVFRLAEVVVGRKTEDYDAKLWNYGKTS